MSSGSWLSSWHYSVAYQQGRHSHGLFRVLQQNGDHLLTAIQGTATVRFNVGPKLSRTWMWIFRSWSHMFVPLPGSGDPPDPEIVQNAALAAFHQRIGRYWA